MSESYEEPALVAVAGTPSQDKPISWWVPVAVLATALGIALSALGGSR